MRLRTAIPILTLALTVACDGGDSPLGNERELRESLALGLNATVVWVSLEGGLWAIRMDDGRLLDPHQTLPEDFRVNNLRVNVEARVLDNMVCIHQVGPIVSVTRILRR